MSTYSVEHAKSNRSSCRKCKEKIGKAELRIGVTSQARDGDHTITVWYHPACFNLPPKLKKQGETAESFVNNILEDTNGNVLEEHREKLINDIGGKSGGKMAKSDKVSVLKARLAKRRAAADDDGRPKKKAKLSTDEERELDIYEKYSKKKNDELKDVLRWNRQGVTGSKDVLLARILDGELNGRLARCPVCGRGKPRIVEANDDKATCSGYFDEDTSSRIPCNHSVPLKDAPRKEWYSEKPTEEQEEIMDKEAEEASGGGASTAKEGGSGSKLLEKAEELDWDLPANASKAKIKAATQALVELCTGDDVSKLSIPTGRERMEIGKIVVSKKGDSAKEVMQAIIDRFGFAQDKEDAAKKRSAAVSSVCANAANAAIMEAMLELSNLYFKEKNSNAGATYRKVANAIKDIDFEITVDNAKGLGKGKTKVANIGKSSADKIYEFVTTGTMEKLEEKRAAAES